MTRKPDPAAGCGLIMIGSTILTFALYLSTFMWLGWRGPVTLLLMSIIAGAVLVIVLTIEEDRRR